MSHDESIATIREYLTGIARHIPDEFPADKLKVDGINTHLDALANENTFLRGEIVALRRELGQTRVQLAEARQETANAFTKGEKAIAALMDQRAEAEARAERFARAAMCAAELIEIIPYFNGAKVVAAYERFDENWMTTLTADDMTFARGVVGLPEPDTTPAKREGQ